MQASMPVLNEAGVKTRMQMVVQGADASSNGRSIPMDKAVDDVLWPGANGEALQKEHGHPYRLGVPVQEGNI